MKLVIVDTAQIQPYIFGSNRLRENVGASYLVAAATGEWALQSIRKVAQRHNVKDDRAGDRDDPNNMLIDTQQIERDHLDGEVMYAGGGNFVALFREDEVARRFASHLSRRVLEDAPDLQLVIAQQSFDWSESLYMAVQRAFMALNQQKRTGQVSAPLLGLGVTAVCRSTGLPATGFAPKVGADDGSRYPASAQILAKHAMLGEAKDKLRHVFKPPAGYDYPDDLENMGGSAGEFSYIALAHADGNGMGERVRDIGKHTNDNRDYIIALRSFSRTLNKAAQTALRETLELLNTRIWRDGGQRIGHYSLATNDSQPKEIAHITLAKADNVYYLPFRPIVFGGDDLTFVADGRIGLSLLVDYLTRFEDQTRRLNLPGGKATACGGVAILKSHYPFAQAYQLAEQLCKSAKIYRRDAMLGNVSCLDWYFTTTGLSGGLGEIRRIERETAEGKLTLCPISLEENQKEAHRSWQQMYRLVCEFQGKNWAGRRNKQKALREALRLGKTSTQHFLTRYGIKELLPLPGSDDFQINGWAFNRCGYFDALELADWYIPLVEGPEVHA
ncbi:MAG: hypothetical protein M1546_23875 [Chloroflexi bacterium]|nr:hypothetical protein [Chloroflexota bacterium]